MFTVYPRRIKKKLRSSPNQSKCMVKREGRYVFSLIDSVEYGGTVYALTTAAAPQWLMYLSACVKKFQICRYVLRN